MQNQRDSIYYSSRPQKKKEVLLLLDLSLLLFIVIVYKSVRLATTLSLSLFILTDATLFTRKIQRDDDDDLFFYKNDDVWLCSKTKRVHQSRDDVVKVVFQIWGNPDDDDDGNAGGERRRRR